MTDSDFVGFAKSPKQREGVVLQDFVEVLVLPVNRKVASAALFSKSNATNWLGSAKTWELSVGAKLVFEAGVLAGQTLVVAESNLPRAITLVTESFGELRVTFSRLKASTKIELTFSRFSLPEEFDQFESTTSALVTALNRAIGTY